MWGLKIVATNASRRVAAGTCKIPAPSWGCEDGIATQSEPQMSELANAIEVQVRKHPVGMGKSTSPEKSAGLASVIEPLIEL
jgi:hypothetical protein